MLASRPEQHAAGSIYAGSDSRSGTPLPMSVQPKSDAVKPVETITFKDGSVADVFVVGTYQSPDSLLLCI